MFRANLRNLLGQPTISRMSTRFTNLSHKEARAIFDEEFYQENNPDIAESGYDPFLHFLRFGFAEARESNAQLSSDYVFNSSAQSAMVGESLNAVYLASGLSEKPRLLFVSHDATRTGAPAILLRLLQMFSESGAFECFTVLDEGGDRLPEFEATSHVHVMSKARRDHSFSDSDALEELSFFLRKKGVFEGNRPVCAIVNSAESYRIGRNLSALGIPVISLIHEIAAYYPPEIFEAFSNFSEKLIFPSQFVKMAATQHCKQEFPNVVVRGQGLLQDNFGALDREQCRKMLREDLQIEDDAFVILNVGSKDIRKGTDLFVELAAIFKKRGPKAKPVYFVWYGGADETFDYAQKFVEQHGLQDCIRLMPPTSEIERIFMGADVFLLTARADPFPCVIHEAMSCGLPVIAFKNGGGAPELIGDDCGAVVEMASLTKAADAIEMYLDSPDLHQRHAANAKAKIERDWSYWDYHRDIYNLVKQSAQAPAGGWPAISPPIAPTHLLIARGTAEDLEVIKSAKNRLGDEAFEVALIGGRYCGGIEQTVLELQRVGLRYRVYQPTDDTLSARKAIVKRLLNEPRPQRVSFINTLDLVALDQLKTITYPMSATLTSETVPLDDLYLMLVHLDKLHLSDEALCQKVCALNPLFPAKIERVEKPSR